MMKMKALQVEGEDSEPGNRSSDMVDIAAVARC